MKASSPIGLFDSGLGGLTVLNAVQKALPKEDFIFLADNQRIPYGDLSPETLSQCVSNAISFLEKKGVKLILLACHTASATWLKTKTHVPVMGMIESSVKALEPYSNAEISIFGTPATIDSRVYEYFFECAYGQQHLKAFSFPKLAAMIESNWIELKEMEFLIEQTIGSQTLDVVLLGCTHYPLIQKSIQKVVGDKVTLIDPSFELARDVTIHLEKRGLLNLSGGNKREFYVTDAPALFFSQAERYTKGNAMPDLCTI